MEHLFDLPAAELCKILSNPGTLSNLELAVRRLLEKMYSPAELLTIKERACLDASPSKVIGVGQVRRL